jgi:[ribosomal protein S5]-alanine N-acetyltransferase
MNTPVPFPSMETERLLLREIVESDAEDLFAIRGDLESMRWFGIDPLNDLAAAQGLVKKLAGGRNLENPSTAWAIQTKDDPKLLGTCGLFSWNRNWRKCVVGYELAAQAQGRGLMREALCAVLSWGFNNMELNRVEAQIHPNNYPSIKLAKALKFVEEGRLREIGLWGGRYHDMLQFSLLRREWQSSE